MLDSNNDTSWDYEEESADMKEYAGWDNKFVPSDVKRVVIGPGNDRPGATKLGQNQSITQKSRSMRSDDKRWLRCILCTAGRNCYRFLVKNSDLNSDTNKLGDLCSN